MLRYPELFDNYFKAGSSGCLGALRTRVNGASGYPDVTVHALCGFLWLESGFLFFPQASKTFFRSFLSCNSTIWFKSFHIASSILKGMSHALTGPIFSRSVPSNAVFYSRQLNLSNKTLALSSQQLSTACPDLVQPAIFNNLKIGKNGRVWRDATCPKKKAFAYFSYTRG